MLETFSDSQMMAVLEQIACAAFVVDVDPDGGFRYVGLNKAHTASSGVTLDMIAGKRPHEVLPQNVADRVCDNYRRCVEARAPIRYDEHLVLVRQSRWWSTSLMPLSGADGRVVRILGTSFDISARKAMETELRRSREFLQSVIDHVPLPLFCKDAGDLRYVFVNRAAAGLVGQEPGAVAGSTDFDLYPPDQAAAFQAGDRTVLTSGEPLTIANEIVTTPVGDRVLRTHKVAIPDESGEPRWLLGVSEDETERRRSEDAANAANSFLNAILDNLPAVVFCKEAPSLRYILVNRAGEEFTGRPREELLGRTDFELVPEEVARARTAEDRQILESGRALTKVENLPATTGLRRVRTTKLAVSGPDGTSRIILGIRQDETEAHRAEARLRDAIESLRDGFVLFDRDDRLVMHNARFLEFYPYLKGRPVIGRTFRENIEDGAEWRRGLMSDAEVRRYIERRLASWRSGGEAFEQQLPGGRWVLVSERPTADGGIVGVHTDITEQKQAETRLMDAIESIDQGFILCDADDRILLSNRRIREMFPSIGPAMLPGASLRDLVRRAAESGDYVHPGESVEEATETIYRMFRQGTAEGIERRLRDGRWILFTQTVTPHGMLVGLRTDITLLKQREQQLTEVRDHLQKQTAELTRLTDDLHVARQRAEDASMAKSQFLAMISHELRTPFTGIRGMADLLAGTALDPEQSRYLDVMRRSIERLLTLLDQLLDFSRIEAGRIEIADLPMAPARLVADVATTFAASARAKGLALERDIAPEVPDRVLGDPAKTSQVIANLVGNAVKFTERGRVAIRLAVDAGPGGRFLRWSVEDSGIGLSADEMERLFEPFTQADVSTSRRFGGTGLGLAISKRLVEAMGGTIGVVSRPGEGSSFWFRLPLRATDAEAAPAPEPPSPPLPPPPSHPRRVLIAEDDPINQMLIDTMLKRWDFETIVVGDGQAALDRLASEPFDAVLMDVNMPVLDGPTAVARLRAGEGRQRDIPVYALTADVLPEHVARFRSAGFTDVLTKPVEWGRLRELLDTAARRIGPLGNGPGRQGSG
ncbi:PAS domain-containing protein [Stella sp.]|uniref:PAS domain-containing protein n=1 Tax=Stella sp. TaxID=2912054 RepID=UPI0035B2DD37